MVSKKVVSVVDISAVNFIFVLVIVCQLNEHLYVLPVCVPQGNYVVNITFPNERFVFASAQ